MCRKHEVNPLKCDGQTDGQTAEGTYCSDFSGVKTSKMNETDLILQFGVWC